MLKGLIGKKLGMTQVFDENGTALPVTLIEAGPCFVTQIRSMKKMAIPLSNSVSTRSRKSDCTGGELGHLKRNNCPHLNFCVNFQSRTPG